MSRVDLREGSPQSLSDEAITSRICDRAPHAVPEAAQRDDPTVSAGGDIPQRSHCGSAPTVAVSAHAAGTLPEAGGAGGLARVGRSRTPAPGTLLTRPSRQGS